MYLRMELHRPDFLRLIFHGSQRTAASGHDSEASGKFKGFVAVRHPYIERRRQTFKQARLAFDVNLRMAVLALGAGTDFASELVRDEVQAIANAEHGQAQCEHAVVSRRSVMIVNGRRPSAQDN